MIEKIKLGAFESKSARTWSLRRGSAGLRSKAVLCTSHETIAQVLAALHRTHVSSVSQRSHSQPSLDLTVSDPGGATWGILADERGSTRWYREGKEQDRDAFREGWARALGLPLQEPWLRIGHLHLADGKIMIQDKTSYDPESDIVRTRLNQEQSRIEENLRQALGPQVVLNDTTQDLLARLVRISRECAMLRDERSQLQGGSTRDPILKIEQLQHESDLLKKIDSLARPFLDPSESPSTLRSKLRAAEGEIRDIMNRSGLLGLPASDRPVPWKEIVEARCAREVLLACESTTRQGEERVERLFAQLSRDLGGIVDDALQFQQKTLAEAARASQPPTERGASIKEEPVERSHSVTRLQSLASRVAQSLRSSIKSTQPATPSDLHSLAAASLSQTVKRLNDMKDFNAVVQAELSGAMRECSRQSESLRSTFCQLADRWSALADRYSLDPSMTLAQLLVLLADWGRLILLQDEARSLRSRIKELNEYQVELRSLVLEWRTLTQSQHDEPLDRPNVLLTAARDILRYREDRERRLQEQSRTGAEWILYRSLQEALDQKIRGAEEAERTIIDQLRITAPRTAHELLAIAPALDSLRALKELQKQLVGPRLLTPDEWTSVSAASGLTVVWISGRDLTTVDRLAILGWGTRATGDAPITLLLMEDTMLADLLAKKGFGLLEEASDVEANPHPQEGHNQHPALEVFSRRTSAAPTPGRRAPLSGGAR